MSAKLPSGWKEVPLPDVVFFQEGPGLRSFQFRESGVPFLNIRTFQNGRIDSSLCQFLDPDEVSIKYKHFLLQEDDIVCSTSGTIGKVATITKDDLPLMLNTSVVRFRPLDEKQLGRGWIRLFLQTQYFLKQARGAATGSAQVNFGPSHIRKMSFILPPPGEQRRIVAEIEKQFTRLEAGVAALRRVQANLKRYRAAVLKAACEGKLVPTEAELRRQRVGRLPSAGVRVKESAAASRDAAYSATPFETGAELLTRILAERRKMWEGNAVSGDMAYKGKRSPDVGRVPPHGVRGKYKEPAAPDTTNLPPLPEGWTWASVEQISTKVVDGGSQKAKLRPIGHSICYGAQFNCWAGNQF